MIHVKVCGITRPEDALAAREAGADFLGLVFAKSPRKVHEEQAAGIMRSQRGFKNWVGVFVDEPVESIKALAGRLGLEYVQLHGSESSEECRELASEGLQVIKAYKIKDLETLQAAAGSAASYVLLDSHSEKAAGGTGTSFDWSLLDGKEFERRIFLAGGLSDANVGDALRHFTPYAVDVSSGVESRPGIKSPDKIRSFIKAVRQG